MKNIKLNLCITKDDILNKLSLEDRDKYSNIHFINANYNDECVMIECVLSTNKTHEIPSAIHLLSDGKISLDN